MCHTVILYDQDVNLHFPAHYHRVYTERLPRLGCSTTLLAFSSDFSSPVSRQLIEQGHILLKKKRPHSLPGRIAFSLEIILRLLLLFCTHKAFKTADHFLVHDDPVMALFVYIQQCLRGKSLVYRISHLKPESVALERSMQRKISAKIALLLRNFLIVRADHVICMSDTMAEYFLHHVPISQEKITVIPSMIDKVPDANDSENCDSSMQDIQQKMAGKRCEYWLLYIGTIDPRRQPAFLLHVLQEIRQRGYHAGLLVLGTSVDETPRHLFGEQVEQLGLREFVILSRPVPEECLPAIAQLCQVGLSPFPINPIFINNSPLKILEYIRAGILSIGSPIPDQADVITRSTIGLIAENTGQDYADAFEALIQEEDGRKKERIQTAQQWLQENRSLDRAAQMLANILQGMDQKNAGSSH